MQSTAKESIVEDDETAAASWITLPLGSGVEQNVWK